jgi:hypothetical protein
MSKKEGFFRGILDSLQDGVYFVDMPPGWRLFCRHEQENNLLE